MIIALTGLKGSGKNTVADMIPGAYCLGFADPLKKFCGEVFGFTAEELYGPSEARERPSATFRRPDGTPLTARFALQTLGTEWGRNCDPDVWAKSGVARARKLQDFGATVVITDLRFVNEARIVREAGGYVWRIHRKGLTADSHPSEAEVMSDEMEAYVNVEIGNVGTLEELKETVQWALNNHKR
jgi:hypothetical protein